MDEAEEGQLERRAAGAKRTALAVMVTVFGLLAIALLAKGLYPADLPATSDPDFVDSIFDNRAVIWAARLLLGIGHRRTCVRRHFHRDLDWRSDEKRGMAEQSRAVRDCRHGHG